MAVLKSVFLEFFLGYFLPIRYWITFIFLPILWKLQNWKLSNKQCVKPTEIRVEPIFFCGISKISGLCIRITLHYEHFQLQNFYTYIHIHFLFTDLLWKMKTEDWFIIELKWSWLEPTVVIFECYIWGCVKWQLRYFPRNISNWISLVIWYV